HRLPPPFPLRSKDGGRRWRSCTSNLTVGMLCHTQSSIKEIVNELKFPNLSFFGKYFKAHKGMSPKYYRTAYLNTQLSSL
ncbi:helix-turn-helix domain-containing protein, partial [Phocaeicola sp.]